MQSRRTATNREKKRGKKDKKSESEKTNHTDDQGPALCTDSEACKICRGKNHGAGRECFKKAWADSNADSNKRFEDSAKGKEWLEKHSGKALYSDRQPNDVESTLVSFKPSHRGMHMMLDPNIPHKLFVSLCRNSTSGTSQTVEQRGEGGGRGRGRGR